MDRTFKRQCRNEIKTNTQEIILKQKEHKEKKRNNKLNKSKKEIYNQKKKSTANQKSKHRKTEKHKNNKKIAIRRGYPGETNERSKNPRPRPKNKTTQTTK